jgi:hypothetical protein
MSHIRSRHHRSSGYRFKKWFRRTRLGSLFFRRRFEKPSPDIVFLTSEEVKASLTKARPNEPINYSTNSSSIPEPSFEQYHRNHHHHSHRERSKHRWKPKGIFTFFGKKPANKQLGVSTPMGNTIGNPRKNIPWKNYIKPTLVSTAMFMVAYQLSWFFYQLAVMITASFYGIDSVLFYYEVMFPEGSNSLKWTPEKIIIITLAGPSLALVVWSILHLILQTKERFGAHLRLFLVWLYLISMMLFFGSFIGGAITLEGFGYVIDWLFMSIPLRLILSLIFIIIIIALSWNVIRFMPETIHSHSWKNNRYKFVFSRLIVPWFLGSVFMTFLKITNHATQHENIFDYDTINLATLLFAVVPPLFNSGTRPQLIRHRKANQKLKKALPVIWIGCAIILVMLFRIVLSYGIYFQLIFNLNLHFYN